MSNQANTPSEKGPMAVNPFTGGASTVKINTVSIDLQPDGRRTVTGEVATP